MGPDIPYVYGTSHTRMGQDSEDTHMGQNISILDLATFNYFVAKILL